MTDCTKEFVNAKNTLADIINSVAPEVLDYFRLYKIRYKNDGSLFKKNNEELRAIISNNRVFNKFDNANFYLFFDLYCKNIKIQVRYSSSEHTWAYIEDYLYIDREFTPISHINIDDVYKWRKELSDLETVLCETRYKISTIKRNLNIR